MMILNSNNYTCNFFSDTVSRLCDIVPEMSISQVINTVESLYLMDKATDKGIIH